MPRTALEHEALPRFLEPMLLRAGLPRVHIEAAPSRHAVAAGFFLYSFEPGGNRIEVTTGGYFVYEPDPEPLMWTEAERARGQAWGVKTVESFHYYGTPPTDEDRAYAEAAGIATPDR